MKFGRNYRLLIQDSDTGLEALEIQSSTNAFDQDASLTIQFDIVRNIGSSMNTMILKIYNLSPTSREIIYQELFDSASAVNAKDYRTVKLQAGYDELSTVFVGDLIEAYSFKQGSDIITYLRCRDGQKMTFNAFSNFTLKEGESITKGISRIVKDLTSNGGKEGVISPTIGLGRTLSRGLVLIGNSWDLLNNLFPRTAFIDLNKINTLEADECTNPVIPLIDSSTGLLGSPRRRTSIIDIEMLFEPRLEVGQFLQVTTPTTPIFNGQYKVVGIRHNGTISSAVGGEIKTTAQLYIGTAGLRIVG